MSILGKKNPWLSSSPWRPANRRHTTTSTGCSVMVSEVASCLVSNHVKRANQVSLSNHFM